MCPEINREKYFIKVSLAAHVVLILFLWGLAAIFTQKMSSPDVVEFRVIESPKKVSRENVMPLKAAPIIQKIKKKKAKRKKSRKVFGATKKSLTSEKSDALIVKKGNTISKEVDSKILKKTDEESLPIPEEEFLVTSMPRIQEEFRAPYPQEAKKQGVEGKVILEILVDQYGKVRKAKVLSSPNDSLSESALKSIYRFKFVPAKVGSKSVAVVIKYAINFVLE